MCVCVCVRVCVCACVHVSAECTRKEQEGEAGGLLQECGEVSRWRPGGRSQGDTTDNYTCLTPVSYLSHTCSSVFQDVDDFFEHEKTFLLEYHNRVKDASAKSDRMIRSHKSKNQLHFRTETQQVSCSPDRKSVCVGASWEM